MNACYYGLAPRLKQRILIRPLAKTKNNRNIKEDEFGNTDSRCFPAVNLLVNYGWEWDVKNGWLSREIPRIDMVIRWGGMRRLSGFLPLQTVYSDFYIVNDLCPDFKEKHLDDALAWYSEQDVTLGG